MSVVMPPRDPIRPVTIRIDETIHNAMRNKAKLLRIQVSLLYEQAAEQYLNERNRSQKAPIDSYLNDRNKPQKPSKNS